MVEEKRGSGLVFLLTSRNKVRPVSIL